MVILVVIIQFLFGIRMLPLALLLGSILSRIRDVIIQIPTQAFIHAFSLTSNRDLSVQIRLVIKVLFLIIIIKHPLIIVVVFRVSLRNIIIQVALHIPLLIPNIILFEPLLTFLNQPLSLDVRIGNIIIQIPLHPLLLILILTARHPHIIIHHALSTHLSSLSSERFFALSLFLLHTQHRLRTARRLNPGVSEGRDILFPAAHGALFG